MKELKKVDLNYYQEDANTVLVSVNIKATAEQIFDSLQDPDTWTEAFDAVASVVWTSPLPLSLGATRTVEINLPGQPTIKVDEEFIGWEENKRMTFYFSHMSKKLFSAVIEDYQIEQLDDGSCNVTWHFGYQGAGIFRPIFWLMKSNLKKDNQKAMDGLKIYLESKFSND